MDRNPGLVPYSSLPLSHCLLCDEEEEEEEEEEDDVWPPRHLHCTVSTIIIMHVRNASSNLRGQSLDFIIRSYEALLPARR
jgi:hypothetical protein